MTPAAGGVISDFRRPGSLSFYGPGFHLEMWAPGQGGAAGGKEPLRPRPGGEPLLEAWDLCLSISHLKPSLDTETHEEIAFFYLVDLLFKRADSNPRGAKAEQDPSVLPGGRGRRLFHWSLSRRTPPRALGPPQPTEKPSLSHTEGRPGCSVSP